MIKYNSTIVPKGFVGITLFPYVFLRYAKDWLILHRGQRYHDKLIRHEHTHLPQQLESLILFPIIYLTHYFILRLRYRNKYSTKKRRKLMAYRDICYEREAKINEQDSNYLKNRKLYSWVKYLKKE